jgi:two-component system NarL family response regulator
VKPVNKGAQAGPARIRVLLADDHKVVRETLAAMFREEPLLEIVGLACDGQDAVEQARKLQPDVLITDISMPRMDGIEVTRLVSKAWPHILILGLTMHTDSIQHSAICEAGAIKCLVKTDSIEELIEAIFAAVRSRPTPPPFH